MRLQLPHIPDDWDRVATVLILFIIVAIMFAVSGCGTYYHVSATGRPTFIHTGDADYMDAQLADGTRIRQHNPRNSQAVTNALKIYGVTDVISQGITAADNATQDAINQ
jgi:hypothetical protein